MLQSEGVAEETRGSAALPEQLGSLDGYNMGEYGIEAPATINAPSNLEPIPEEDEEEDDERDSLDLELDDRGSNEGSTDYNADSDDSYGSRVTEIYFDHHNDEDEQGGGANSSYNSDPQSELSCSRDRHRFNESTRRITVELSKMTVQGSSLGSGLGGLKRRNKPFNRFREDADYPVSKRQKVEDPWMSSSESERQWSSDTD